jgi:hypothetical protein
VKPPACGSRVALTTVARSTRSPARIVPSRRPSGNTLPAGTLGDAEILDLAERQNLDGIGQLPSTVGKPVADRVHLPASDAVRIRWTSKFVSNGKTEQETSVGHSFPAKHTVFTIVGR